MGSFGGLGFLLCWFIGILAYHCEKWYWKAFWIATLVLFIPVYLFVLIMP